MVPVSVLLRYAQDGLVLEIYHGNHPSAGMNKLFKKQLSLSSVFFMHSNGGGQALMGFMVFLPAITS